MKKLACLALTFALTASVARATDLNLTITGCEPTGASTVTVPPGCDVPYAIEGELTDGNSRGLALFAFDLSSDLTGLTPADPPTGFPMENFAIPFGINNPVDDPPTAAGFGGTPSGGVLLQVGGGQNTMMNDISYAPFPLGTLADGTLAENIAQNGDPVILARGTLTIPGDAAPGTYTLSASNVLATVIAADQTGTNGQFLKVEGTPGTDGTVTNLTIIVDASADCCPGEVDLAGSVPPDGSIDARNPKNPSTGVAVGWDQVDLIFTGPIAGLTTADFSVMEKKNGEAAVAGPGIVSATQVDAVTWRLALDRSLTPGAWTKFMYDSTGSYVCIGDLPGDVDQGGLTGPTDIGSLIDCLNGATVCDPWQCDIDRVPPCAAADIGGLVDLLNGTTVFQSWNLSQLPTDFGCPNAP